MRCVNSHSHSETRLDGFLDAEYTHYYETGGPLNALKVIVGFGCILASFCLGFVALILFREMGLFTAGIPVALTLALCAIGIFLIAKRRSPLSRKSKVLISVFMCVLVVSPALLIIHIQHERTILQSRAKEFLLRPVPKLLVPDAQGNVGGFYVDTNSGPQNGVFGYSRDLIERYANNRRIRWSARIQGQFACTSDGVNANYRSDEIKTNEEVRLYLAERNAILSKEWRMGFWQWVEDTIEMKTTIPEHEEEDFRPAASTNAVPSQ